MWRTLHPFRLGGDHRRRLANIGHLLTGNVIGTFLGLASYALTARALGISDYGQLALMLAFVRLFERLVSFQSWQPIIKYGAGLWGEDCGDDLRALLKYGFMLDMSAALAAWACAVASAHFVAPLFGWSEDHRHLLVLYSCVLLFGLSGMPTAVQRLSGNFHLLAYGQLINMVLRVGLCALGVLIAAELRYFVIVWAATQIVGTIVLFALAMRTLHRAGVRRILGAPLRGITSRFAGIWNFSWSSNLSLTLRSSTHELDTLIVGALADPGSAGLYHIAKRIGRAGQQLGAQVQSVIYPDVARLWAKGQLAAFKRVVMQVEGTMLGLGVFGILVVYATVDWLLLWAAGPAFLAAADLVIVQVAAVALVLMGTAARSALLAMGRQRDVLVVVVVGTIAFHLTALLLIPHIGAMGGNVAHIVLGLIWVVGLSASLYRALLMAPGSSITLTQDATGNFPQTVLPEAKGA